MEDTRCGDKCSFVKAGLCECDEDCPNYMESFWETNQGRDTKIVKDCAPKRILLESQRTINRFLGLQGAIEQMRDRLDNLEGLLSGLVVQSKKYLNEEPNKKLENKD